MARYAHIENNEITGVYDFLPDNWRNISNLNGLAEETEFLRSLGWRKINKIPPVYNTETQRMGDPQYTIVDDEVEENIEIIDIPVYYPVYTQPEPVVEVQIDYHEIAMFNLRKERDVRLTETDYTQLADVIALNGEELNLLFVTYRQSLRDLPNAYESDETFTDVNNVSWPVRPGV